MAAELEIARQQLEADLEANGIKFLLSKMNCDEVYSPLVLEKQRMEGSYSSEDTVSIHAFKQSGKLNSPDDKKELLALLSDPAYNDQRRNIYCCLSSLCSNTNDIELFDFLMGVIEKEDDDRTTISILSRLKEMKKPFNANIGLIKRLLVEGTDSIRIAASKALSNTNDPEVEDIILDEFKISDRHSKAMFCTPLESVGTTKSIPVLQEALKQTRDPFLRESIEYVIQLIRQRTPPAGQS